MDARHKVMGPTEWSLLIVLSMLWGGSYFFGKVMNAEIPTFTIVLSRVALGAIALNLLVVATGQRMPTSGRVWATLFVMGLLNNLIPFSLIFWAQHHIPSGLASILNGTTPLLVVVFAHFLTTDEKLTPARLAGVLLGLSGVATMIGPSLIGSNSHESFGMDVVAQLAVLAAACSYACAALFARSYLKAPPLILASGQVTATLLMSLPLALIIDRPWTLAMPSPATWAAMLGLGLLSTALAFAIYFRILAAAGPTNLSLVTFLVPVSALLLGTLILGERLEPFHFAGMALIALGLAAIDGRPLQALQQRLALARPRFREPLEAQPFQDRAACGQGVDQ